MFKRFLILLLSFTLVSCGRVEIDPEFYPYLEDFLDEATEREVEIEKEISIVFVEGFDNPDTVGNCTRGIVRISRKYWKELSESYKEVLMFHEFGHCLLDKRHSTRVGAIMYKYLFVPDEYEDDREKYIDELFGLDVHFERKLYQEPVEKLLLD